MSAGRIRSAAIGGALIVVALVMWWWQRLRPTVREARDVPTAGATAAPGATTGSAAAAPPSLEVPGGGAGGAPTAPVPASGGKRKTGMWNAAAPGALPLELRRDATFAAVNLAGGPATVFRPPVSGEEPALERRVRGRVVDAKGAPAIGAIVIVGGGRSLDAWSGHLVGDGGAVVGGDGRYEVKAPRGPVTALAVTSTEWSRPAVVTAETGDVNLDLTLVGAGALEGRVSYHGGPEIAELQLVFEGQALSVLAHSDADGGFRFDPLPAGTWRVSAALAQDVGGGAGATSKHQVVIDPGKTTRLDLDLRAGVTLAVDVALPGDLEPGTIEYWLFPGAVVPKSAEEASALAKQAAPGQVDWHLLGGQDAQQVMQFHDRDPGRYVVCAKAQQDDKAWFGCQATTITAAPSVQELELELL